MPEASGGVRCASRSERFLQARPHPLPWATMSLPAPSGTPIHQRTYDVQAFRIAPDRLQIRGIVHDQKPPGTYIADDPDPLSVHRMEVDLVIEFPSLTILEVAVEMQVTPHRACNTIEPDYQQLVGLSIARGFSRHVKDLLGGPRGCTHIGALLQAMAPVAIQSSWSMRSLSERDAPEPAANGNGTTMSVDDRKRALAFNLNTCHIWDEDGPQVAGVLRGDQMEIPVWAEERMVKLGRTPEDWRRQ